MFLLDISNHCEGLPNNIKTQCMVSNGGWEHPGWILGGSEFGGHDFCENFMLSYPDRGPSRRHSRELRRGTLLQM